MGNFIIDIMNNYGYAGIFFLITIENLFPPIPSELILTFGGFMTIDTKLTILGVILISTFASLFGAIILYYFGKLMDVDKQIKLAESKTGRILRLKKENIINSYTWFQEKGNKAVFFCRFVPIIRSLISIPAGMNKMNMICFVSYTFFGSLIWNTVLILVGAFAGEYKEVILKALNDFTFLILLVIILIFVYKRKIKKK